MPATAGRMPALRRPENFCNCARVGNLMHSPTISTENLTRRFGELVAVEEVNLRVAPGQFFGFLGPNGAGKSTTIKMLTGLLAPTAGRIQILGLDLVTNMVEVKRQIGVVPEGMALFGRLTGSEYPIRRAMYGLDRETAAKRTSELLEFMQLVDQPKTMVTDYSHGMQKKLALAAAVIHGPKVLFLDEPFEGVDAIAAGTLKSMLQRMIARGATIFLTSHVLEIVERLCIFILFLFYFYFIFILFYFIFIFIYFIIIIIILLLLLFFAVIVKGEEAASSPKAEAERGEGKEGKRRGGGGGEDEDEEVI